MKMIIKWLNYSQLPGREMVLKSVWQLPQVLKGLGHHTDHRFRSGDRLAGGMFVGRLCMFAVCVCLMASIMCAGTVNRGSGCSDLEDHMFLVNHDDKLGSRYSRLSVTILCQRGLKKLLQQSLQIKVERAVGAKWDLITDKRRNERRQKDIGGAWQAATEQAPLTSLTKPRGSIAKQLSISVRSWMKRR